MNKQIKKEYVFRTKYFYEMLEQQKYRCPLSASELTPENTTAEHILPLRQSGKHIKENIYLVDKDVAKLKRYMTEEELVTLAIDIVKTKGKEYGYRISKTK